MTLRRATVDDALDIASVSVETWKDAYRGLLPGDVLEGQSVPLRAKRILIGIQAGDEYWVAEDEGGILGFAAAGPNRDPDVPAAAELYAIYVRPSAQGRGVGKGLLREAALRVQSLGHNSMCVFALRANDQARAFYTGLGAVPYDQSLHTVAGVDYPDQSYVWRSLSDLLARLGVTSPT